MKSSDRNSKAWVSPYKPSPKLPSQRSDTHRGHQIDTARVVTSQQKGRR